MGNFTLFLVERYAVLRKLFLGYKVNHTLVAVLENNNLSSFLFTCTKNIKVHWCEDIQ